MILKSPCTEMSIDIIETVIIPHNPCTKSFISVVNRNVYCRWCRTSWQYCHMIYQPEHFNFTLAHNKFTIACCVKIQCYQIWIAWNSCGCDRLSFRKLTVSIWCFINDAEFFSNFNEMLVFNVNKNIALICLDIITMNQERILFEHQFFILCNIVQQLSLHI